MTCINKIIAVPLPPCGEMEKWQGGTPLDASRPTPCVRYRGLSTGGWLTFGTEGAL